MFPITRQIKRYWLANKYIHLFAYSNYTVKEYSIDFLAKILFWWVLAIWASFPGVLSHALSSQPYPSALNKISWTMMDVSRSKKILEVPTLERRKTITTNLAYQAIPQCYKWHFGSRNCIIITLTVSTNKFFNIWTYSLKICDSLYSFVSNFGHSSLPCDLYSLRGSKKHCWF